MTLRVVAACSLLLASSLAAQQRARGALIADAAIVRFGNELFGARTSQTGPTFAVEGRITSGRVTLGAGYMEGRLQPGPGDIPGGRDIVEARAFLGAQPVPWLMLSAGPRLRAFVTDTSTERWVIWQARARTENALPATPLQTYVELWVALSARVNLPSPVDHMQGGEAGVVFRPAGSRLWMRLGYRVDGAKLGGGNQNEVVEAVALAVGIGSR